MREVFWLGPIPTRCDLEDLGCAGDGSITTSFVDGATIYGPWANMCPACHKQYGRGFGTGRGQRFEKQPDGRFLKVEG